jgi:hypothetical protein
MNVSMRFPGPSPPCLQNLQRSPMLTLKRMKKKRTRHLNGCSFGSPGQNLNLSRNLVEINGRGERI